MEFFRPKLGLWICAFIVLLIRVIGKWHFNIVESSRIMLIIFRILTFCVSLAIVLTAKSWTGVLEGTAVLKSESKWSKFNEFNDLCHHSDVLKVAPPLLQGIIL